MWRRTPLILPGKSYRLWDPLTLNFPKLSWFTQTSFSMQNSWLSLTRVSEIFPTKNSLPPWMPNAWNVNEGEVCVCVWPKHSPYRELQGTAIFKTSRSWTCSAVFENKIFLTNTLWWYHKRTGWYLRRDCPRGAGTSMFIDLIPITPYVQWGVVLTFGTGMSHHTPPPPGGTGLNRLFLMFWIFL